MVNLDVVIKAKKEEIAAIKQMLDNATADLRKLEKQMAEQDKGGYANG